MSEILRDVPAADASETPLRRAGQTVPPVTYPVELFAAADLLELRSELLSSGADSFQAAEIIGSFLSSRGYGVAAEQARSAAAVIEAAHCSAEGIQAALAGVAHVA